MATNQLQFSRAAQVLTSTFCAVEIPVTLRRTFSLCLMVVTACCDCNVNTIEISLCNIGI